MIAPALKTEFEGIFLGNDVKGKCFVDEEGCKDMLFMIGKHVRVTVEVLEDRGTGSTGTVTKHCVTHVLMSFFKFYYTCIGA